ncbi:MAG: peptide chain release factor N(5)-glutamine methyltransferase [Prevotellaceae bacterium]|jgi:release factor glutamine methyltransferase|nr:peptide chain release factor N(5)-glutamine methyltransferase [Prevotellaceae bacterium]
MKLTPRQLRQQLEPAYAATEAANIVRWICCDVWGQSAADYYLDKSMDLSADEAQQWENISTRLLHREPLQYILGEARFFGRTFHVTPDVLIPRPETEELVELLLGEVTPHARILDIGTGSGCIAVTVKLECPTAHVVGWDISAAALDVARRNGEQLQADVEWCRRDVWDEAADDTADSYDVIVSNPPYVTESERLQMEPHVVGWEPHTALFVPDDDPLRFYRRIAELGHRLLSPRGRLYLEINRAFGGATVDLLRRTGYAGDIRLLQDISHNERFVIANKQL